MPIIDWICESCSHVDSGFVPASQCGSDHPETERSICTVCASPSYRNYSGASPSVGFRPIVVHLNTITGEVSVPGHPDDPITDAHYKAISITSMSQYEKFRRGIERTELEKAQFLQDANRQYFDQTVKDHRSAQRSAIETAVRRGGYETTYEDENGNIKSRWAPVTPRALQLFDLSCKFTDQLRESRRQKLSTGRPNFHSRILEHRSSERSVVDGTIKRPKGK